MDIDQSDPNGVLYTEDYFTNRSLNDVRRIRSFRQESEYVAQYCDKNGVILDIGCSTGEFLSAIEWTGTKYGLEISDYARDIAIKSGIMFDDGILDKCDVLDVVVFRGTIQHLPDPFRYIQRAYTALRPGGIIVFLATPNANSVVFKVSNTLPALDARLNYWIPSDVTLRDNLENTGFQVLNMSFPYVSSPYSKPLMDHLQFLLMLSVRCRPDFAFWRNMMNVIARKPYG